VKRAASPMPPAQRAGTDAPALHGGRVVRGEHPAGDGSSQTRKNHIAGENPSKNPVSSNEEGKEDKGNALPARRRRRACSAVIHLALHRHHAAARVASRVIASLSCGAGLERRVGGMDAIRAVERREVPNQQAGFFLWPGRNECLFPV